jgi:tetratricopeptide (TPR) repeat protein
LSDEESLRVQELLEKGLYYYGLGENRMAVELWRQVLDIDPENELAREYIEIEMGASAFATDVSTSSTPVSEEDTPQAQAMPQSFTKGQQLIYEAKPAEAVKSFSQAYEESGQLYHWAYVELAKTSLLKQMLENLGSLERIPELTRPMKELAEMHFSEEEGFMLSLITGDTSLDDIISLSPLPKFKTYRTLHGFLEDGIIRIKNG